MSDGDANEKLMAMMAQMQAKIDQLSEQLSSKKKRKRSSSSSSDGTRAKKLKSFSGGFLYNIVSRDGSSKIVETLDESMLSAGDNVSHHESREAAEARDPKQIWAYTDGSYKLSAKRSGFGVYIGHQDSHNISQVEATGNAQTMEVLAMLAVLRMWRDLPAPARQGRKLHVCTDSAYVYNTLWGGGGSGVGWAYGWRRNQQVEKKSFDRFMECLDILDDLGDSISAEHVRSHCGIFGNEMADILAKGEHSSVAPSCETTEAGSA